MASSTSPLADVKLPRIEQLAVVIDVSPDEMCRMVATACMEAPITLRPLPVPGKSMSELVTVITLTPATPAKEAT